MNGMNIFDSTQHLKLSTLFEVSGSCACMKRNEKIETHNNASNCKISSLITYKLEQKSN